MPLLLLAVFLLDPIQWGVLGWSENFAFIYLNINHEFGYWKLHPDETSEHFPTSKNLLESSHLKRFKIIYLYASWGEKFANDS